MPRFCHGAARPSICGRQGRAHFPIANRLLASQRSPMLHALPGMGADHRVFGNPAWHTIEPIRFIDWPQSHGETSIPQIATRVADENDVRPGDIVIGMSLGGIVGCEIANQVELRALVLISSAIHPREVPRVLAKLHPLARVVPFGAMRKCARALPGEVCAMFADSEPRFIRAMCAAIFRWSGLAPNRITPIRIHGRRDPVIPAPRKCDLRIDGGHLVAMTHAGECVDFIRDRVLQNS